ncbi:hypothetical protein LCGC14_2270180 [marine sediment metagenome]|uniref:Uncharacterized protein n=1 Tax=marine sediment metagenome TaxID=412755 RepID=A0A0F9CX62_9ZZZZ
MSILYLRIKKWLDGRTQESRTKRIHDLEEAIRTAIIVMKNRDSYPSHELAARVKWLEKVLESPRDSEERG